jgi:hypothetical protein
MISAMSASPPNSDQMTGVSTGSRVSYHFLPVSIASKKVCLDRENLL